MFAAVLPPQEIVEEINSLLAPRREALPMLRWTRPEGWHLTTAFMEDVDEYRVEPLIDALGEVAGSHEPFDISVGGGYALPHPDTAKIIVLGVSRGSDDSAGSLLLVAAPPTGWVPSRMAVGSSVISRWPGTAAASRRPSCSPPSTPWATGHGASTSSP